METKIAAVLENVIRNSNLAKTIERIRQQFSSGKNDGYHLSRTTTVNSPRVGIIQYK
jgi:hypothetical protein